MVSPTDGAHCRSVILPLLLEIGRAGVQGNTPGLCQSIAYMNIFKKFTRSDCEKLAKGTLTFIDKAYHESSDSWLHIYHLFTVAS